MSLSGLFVRAPRAPGEPFWRRVRAGWRLLVFVAILETLGALPFVFMQAVLHLQRPAGMPPGLLAIGETLQFAFVALGTLIVARLERRRFATYGLAGRVTGSAGPGPGGLFWAGWLWGFLAVVLLVALILAARGLTIDGLAIHGAEAARYTALWTITFLGVGLYEELYFRGYSLFTLTTGIGFWPAALLLSALFGAIHFFLKPMENLFDLATVSLIGLFFCLTLRRTGSLWFAIGFHFAFDWAALFVFAAPNTANQGRPLEGHLLAVSYTGPAWLTGGPLGIEASVMMFAVIAALFALFNARYRERRWPAEDPEPGTA